MQSADSELGGMYAVIVARASYLRCSAQQGPCDLASGRVRLQARCSRSVSLGSRARATHEFASDGASSSND